MDQNKMQIGGWLLVAAGAGMICLNEPAAGTSVAIAGVVAILISRWF